MDDPDLKETERLQRLYTRRVAEREASRTDTHASAERIVAMIRREGSEEERLATMEHVMACADCHRDYEWLKAVDQAATEAGGGAESGGLPFWRRAPLALAASIAVALGAGLLVTRLRSDADTVRGGEDGIALLAPADTASGVGVLAFAWRPLPEATGYVLEIQRPDGSVVFTDTTSDTLLALADPEAMLPPAEYRWWVREVTEGAEPRASDHRDLRLTGR
jgi:hypothetical protein